MVFLMCQPSMQGGLNKSCMMFRIIFFLVFFYYLLTFISLAEQSRLPRFECLPWEVGQFVEYQIIHPENEGIKNRYKITLVSEEIRDGKVYFWEKIDIFENIYCKKGELFRKNITFLALVEPVTSDKYNRNIAQYIQNGFWPKDAVELKVQFYDGPFVDVNPSLYFAHQNIIEDTPYSRSPDALGRIDFSRMKLLNINEEVTVPSGTWECGHIFVSTEPQKEYFDEGFDLWRSPKVPLLGIVRMDFSKTAYWNKWFYRNSPKAISSIRNLLSYIMQKKILGRTRSDTYSAQLINYGPVEQNEK